MKYMNELIMLPSKSKTAVREFWDAASCGERLLLPARDREGFEQQANERFRLEPYIVDFAAFSSSGGRQILEIGVGLGADHQRFVEAGAVTTGVDLTPRAIELTEQRLQVFGLHSRLLVADAEYLPFSDGQFDTVYSWGVIHHSPDTPRVVQEILRVLRSGGNARIMIYSKWSLVGIMLWTRYALLRGRPWTPLSEIYAKHLESPGTKAYTVAEARRLFAGFDNVRIRTVLTHGDLLSSGAGQRHGGAMLSLARRIWPRGLIRTLLPGWGLFMLIEGTKPVR